MKTKGFYTHWQTGRSAGRRLAATTARLAEKLFGLTHALEDAFRIARILNETAQYGALLQFLEENQALVEQAAGLKTILSWSF